MAKVKWRVIKTGAAAAFASLLISGTSAAAEESGVYVTASYGKAPKLFSRSDLDDAFAAVLKQTLTLESSSARKHDTIWSAGVGYRMGQNVAVEATYFDLGKIHYDAAGSALLSGTNYATAIDLDTRSRGPALALVWVLPLWNAWGVDTRAGIYHGKTSTRYVTTLGENERSHSGSANSTSLLLGIGGSYTATEHLIVRLDYFHLNDIKEEGFNAKFDADIVTAGMTYQF